MTIGELTVENVSRETLDRLQSFHDLLLRWTASINLVAPSTVSQAWNRHIVDSAQVFYLMHHDAQRHIDLGSGGGLPGIVISIIAMEKMPLLHTTLIESDQRKATFLRTVVRELGLNASVRCARIEDVTDAFADVVTARALAPLDHLLGLVKPLLKADGLALLPKGRQVDSEIKAARRSWDFELVSHQSRTDRDSRILQIRDIQRASS